MKKLFNLFILMLVSLMALMCLNGCGSDSSTDKNQSKSKAQAIKIEDIEWSVDEGVTDGKRLVLMNYTNNSKYTIVEFELKFKQKNGISDEEKTKFYNDIKERWEIDENDPSDAKQFEELKKKEISMHAESERMAKAGETVSAVKCKYYSGGYDVKNIEHYSLVVPDIATIKYIENSKVMTEYYDFSSKKYSADSKSENSYYWTDKGLETMIPKPEAEYVKEDGIDNSSCFMFRVYGWSLDDFNSYVKQCKEMGFSVDVSEFKGFFSADNANGYNIHMYYYEDDFSMSATISKKAEEKQ